MQYKNVDTSFFHFATNHAFDRRMDSFLMATPCVALNAVACYKPMNN